MDLHDFEGQGMYFDEPIPASVKALLDEAAQRYETGQAELPLLRAYFIAPRSLMVLVGLYRFYYYQHRLDDALVVAERALKVVGERLDLPRDWRALNEQFLGSAVLQSMGLARFYLLVLKGAGYLCLRRGRSAEGLEMLQKVAELDVADRLGAAALLRAIAPFVVERESEERIAVAQ
jgi:tetratricopeptide (TPR) repeat protein